MVSFGEKAKIKKAGNLNEGRSYDITTVFLFNFLNYYKTFQALKYKFDADFFY